MAEVSSPLTSVARKRRREVIQTKRAVTAQVAEGSTATPNPTSTEVLPPKKRKIPIKKESIQNETAVVSASIPDHFVATSVPDPTAAARAATLPETKPTPPATTSTTTVAASDPISDNDKSQFKKKARTQIQYNPGVPMSKEQLAAWRREMRRMRNRESAAASRQKIRDRIECLEEEVNEWKAKYDEAMRRLTQTEQALLARRQN